jgi:hypothetical protein
MTVFLLMECIIFDVYLTLASWSGAGEKYTHVAAKISSLILKGKENVNDYVTEPSVVRSVDRYRWRFGGCGPNTHILDTIGGYPCC